MKNKDKGLSSNDPSGVSEHLQTQVQIRDLRSIPASVKSNEYILAKIQNHLHHNSGSGSSSRGSPDIELRLTSSPSAAIGSRESPRQRKV